MRGSKSGPADGGPRLLRGAHVNVVALGFESDLKLYPTRQQKIEIGALMVLFDEILAGLFSHKFGKQE
jgi:hypothetical protein